MQYVIVLAHLTLSALELRRSIHNQPVRYLPPTEAELENWTAHHEAGHIVIHRIMFERSPWYATIKRSGQFPGAVRPAVNLAEVQRDEAIHFHLAGICSEEMFVLGGGRNCSDERAGSKDRDDARALIKLGFFKDASPTNEDLAAIEQTFKQSCKAILISNATFHQKLVALLLQDKKILNFEIDELF